METLQSIVEHSEPIDFSKIVDEDGHTILTKAASACNSIILEALLLRGGARVINELDGRGMAPIHYRVFDSDAILDILLFYGANIDCQTAQGDTLMHFAAERGATEMLLLYKTHGSNAVSIKNKMGYTPRDLALRAKHMNTVATLDTFKYNTYWGERRYLTALHMMAVQRSTEDVKLFLSLNPRTLTVRDRRGNTPLHCAVFGRNRETLKLLCIDIDAQNDKRQTPLHLAVRGPKESILTLHALGTQAHFMKDDDGRFPAENSLVHLLYYSRSLCETIFYT
jgi:ankyrin repeat protein